MFENRVNRSYLLLWEPRCLGMKSLSHCYFFLIHYQLLIIWLSPFFSFFNYLDEQDTYLVNPVIPFKFSVSHQNRE